ncbi:hypothetical protein [Longispora urticae]
MEDVLDHPLFRKLLSLNLSPEDFVVAGSGPLFARGWIQDPSDLDIVVDDHGWRRALQWGVPHAAPFGYAEVVNPFGAEIEVLNAWFGWNVDRLIDDADVIAGIRFARLDVVATTKLLVGRPRDLVHLEIMRRHGLPC